MKRGSVVGINDDPAWAQLSEFDTDMVAYHWAQLLTIELPGLVGEDRVRPAVCVERYNRVTDDEKHMVVGDYSFTFDLGSASCRLAGPDDLDELAARFHAAAEQLRAFVSAEGVSSIVTTVPRAKRTGA